MHILTNPKELNLDDLIRLNSSLPPSSVWIMSERTCRDIRYLKDANGYHVWICHPPVDRKELQLCGAKVTLEVDNFRAPIHGTLFGRPIVLIDVDAWVLTTGSM